MIRAVLDANVYASALIRPTGPCGRILRSFVEHRSFALLASPSILDETERCLFYPKVRKRIALSDAAIRQWLAAVAIMAEVVSDHLKLDVVSSDPDDNKVLAAAIEGHASHIVTGDTDLLELKLYEGVTILRPALFETLLSPQQPK